MTRIIYSLYYVLMSGIMRECREELLLGHHVRSLITSVNNAQMVRFPSMDNLVDFTRYQCNRTVHIADGRTPLDSAMSFVSPDLHAYPRDKEPTVTTF